jgi:hypothetical protein
MNRDYCGIEARAGYDSQGQLQNIQYWPSKTDCLSILTTTDPELQKMFKTLGYDFEEYGPETTLEVPLTAGHGKMLTLRNHTCNDTLMQ